MTTTWFGKRPLGLCCANSCTAASYLLGSTKTFTTKRPTSRASSSRSLRQPAASSAWRQGRSWSPKKAELGTSSSLQLGIRLWCMGTILDQSG